MSFKYMYFNLFFILLSQTLPCFHMLLDSENLAEKIQDDVKETTNIPVDPGGVAEEPGKANVNDIDLVHDAVEGENIADSDTHIQEEEKKQFDTKNDDETSTNNVDAVRIAPELSKTGAEPSDDDGKSKEYHEEEHSGKEDVSEVTATEEGQESLDKISEERKRDDATTELEDANMETMVTYSQDITPMSHTTVTEQVSNQNKEFDTFYEFVEIAKLEDGQNQKTKSTKQRKVNVASKDCGAKVMASNPEAENAKSILTSNKDEYMINPCKAKKWVVIELCEPARVKNVEIASFELFSSQPKQFKIHLAEQYPTKEWKSVDVFTAQEARTLQSFVIPDTFNDYVKYVKLELLDHYGEEHFCPVTVFKVNGVLVDYESFGEDGNNDEDSDDNDGDMDAALLNDGSNSKDTSDSPKNLFASAKDTVMKLVKKVLQVDEKEQGNQAPSNSSNNTEEQTIPLTTQPVKESLNISDDGYLLPCVPGLDERSEDALLEEKKGLEPKVPCVSKTGEQTEHGTSSINNEHVDSNIPNKKDDKDSSYTVTKLEDHEQVPSIPEDQPFVILLDPESEEKSLRGMVDKCRKRCKLLQVDSRKPQKSSSFCAYVKLWFLKDDQGGKKVKPSVSQDKSVSTSKSASTSVSVLDEGSVKKASDSIMSNVPDISEASTMVQSTTSDNQNLQESSSIKNAEKSSQKYSQVTQVSTQTYDSTEQKVQHSHSEFQLSDTLTSTRIVESTLTEIPSTSATKNIEQMSEQGLDTKVSEVAIDPSSSLQVSQANTKATPVLEKTTVFTTSTQSVLEVSSPVMKSIEEIVPSVSLSDGLSLDLAVSKPHQAVPSEPSVAHTAPIVSTPSESPKSLEKEHYIENETEIIRMTNSKDTLDTKSIDIVKVPMMPLPKREIAIMRLANRINSLEMNVTLSIRFLEAMSQKFKVKSDEIQSMVEKTDKNLKQHSIEMNKKHDEQQIYIQTIENKVQNLTSMIYDLSKKFQNLDEKLSERQMVWITIEVGILVLIFITSWTRSKLTCSIHADSVTSSCVSTPEKYIQHLPPVTPRRYSHSDSLGWKPGKKDEIIEQKYKYGSAENLACNASGTSKNQKKNCETGNHIQLKDKKKKKKKKSQDIKVKSSVVSLGDSEFPKDSKAFNNSAGVLFYGDKDLIPATKDKQMKEEAKNLPGKGVIHGSQSLHDVKNVEKTKFRIGLSSFFSTLKSSDSGESKISTVTSKKENFSDSKTLQNSVSGRQGKSSSGTSLHKHNKYSTNQLGSVYDTSTANQTSIYGSSDFNVDIGQTRPFSVRTERNGFCNHTSLDGKLESHGSDPSIKYNAPPTPKSIHVRASSVDYSPIKPGTSNWRKLIGWS